MQRLSVDRLALEANVKALKAQTEQLRAVLSPRDPRQAALAELLAARRPSPEAVRAHLAAHPHGTGATDKASTALRHVAAAEIPDPDVIADADAAMAVAQEAVDVVAATDAARALATAEFLRRALELRDPARLADDCPVCGTSAVLDAAWEAQAREESERLRAQAAELDGATSKLAAARSVWRALTDRLATAADEPTGRERSLEQATALAAHARAVAERARKLLHEQDAEWRSRTEAATAWVHHAREVEREAHRLKALKSAETWLKAEADALRNERFAPIAGQAIANWDELKHESNVELHDISLRTVGRGRVADFDVRADGEEASALGVMSQGELLALSVSVFLPRAGLEESPFRFAVIDDPVQSMDPAKVDGLARVLSRAAQTRQVVVFTHDDRLPEAIRRLKVSATVLQVNRRSRSQVHVNESLTPMRRHLDDAKRIATSTQVPAEVQQRVVPSLCHDALEAACAELVRTKAVARGRSAHDADEDLGRARSLRDQLSLALLDEPGHAGLTDALRVVSPDAPSLVHALNAGAHGEYQGSPLKLQERTRELVVDLMQSA